MAIISSHLLNSTNGTHASGVKIIVNKITRNGKKIKFIEAITDKNGRFFAEFALSKKDTKLDFEIIFKTAKYFSKQRNVSEIVIKFNMKNQKKKYHMPIIISPNGYSVWWSK
tara:strand:+ start:4886 stop:5221 length:336 start_codon:yes stop_codon:yes gene_type:complete